MVNYVSNLGFGNIFCAIVAIILGLASGLLSVGHWRALRDIAALGLDRLWRGFNATSFVPARSGSAEMLANNSARKEVDIPIDDNSEKLNKGKNRAMTESTGPEQTKPPTRKLSEEEKAALVTRRLMEKREMILSERVAKTGIGPSYIGERSENMRKPDRDNHQESASFSHSISSRNDPAIELSPPTNMSKQAKFLNGKEITNEVVNKTHRKNPDDGSKTRDSDDARAMRKKETMRLYMIKRAEEQQRRSDGEKPSGDATPASSGSESTLKATREQMKKEEMRLYLAKKAAKAKAQTAVPTAADDDSDAAAHPVANPVPAIVGEDHKVARTLRHTTLTTDEDTRNLSTSPKVVREKGGIDNAPDGKNTDISESGIKRPTSSSRALLRRESEDGHSANIATDGRTSASRQASVGVVSDEENKTQTINSSSLVAADEIRRLEYEEGAKPLSSNEIKTQTADNVSKNRTTSELPPNASDRASESRYAKETARAVAKARAKEESSLLQGEKRLRRRVLEKSQSSIQDQSASLDDDLGGLPTLEARKPIDKAHGEAKLRLKGDLRKEPLPSKHALHKSLLQAPSGKKVLEVDQTDAMPSISLSVTPATITETFGHDKKGLPSQDETAHSPVAPNDSNDELATMQAEQKAEELASREYKRKHAEEKEEQKVNIQPPGPGDIASRGTLERAKASDPPVALESDKILKSALKKPSVSFAGITEPGTNEVSNFFLSKTGPGRPALIPFPHGLHPKAGKPPGTLWFDNIPKDASQLMVPVIRPRKKSTP